LCFRVNLPFSTWRLIVEKEIPIKFETSFFNAQKITFLIVHNANKMCGIYVALIEYFRFSYFKRSQGASNRLFKNLARGVYRFKKLLKVNFIMITFYFYDFLFPESG